MPKFKPNNFYKMKSPLSMGDYNKSERRYNKLANKAEQAIQEDKINKNQRLVKKANKLNKRKDLGKDDIAFGMNKVYQFNAELKEASKQGKLDNNPKFKAAVDNAPLQMKDQHSFREGTVNKMKSFGDTVYSMEVNGLMDPNKKKEISIGDTGNFNNEFMEVASIDNIANLRTKTYDDMRAAGASEEEINAAKAFNQQKYGTQNPTAAGLTNNTVVDSYNKIVGLKSIPQPGGPEVKGDAFTSYDRRQEIRQGKNVTGQSIRNKNKIRRAEKRIDKLQTRARANADITDPKFLKKQKRFQDKINKTNIRKEGLQERQSFLDTSKSNYKKQLNQGINPKFYGKNRVTLQAGSPGSSTTPAKKGGLNFIPTKNLTFNTFGMKKPFAMKKTYGMYKSRR